MKRGCFLLLMVAFLFSSLALAKDNTEGKVKLTDPVRIGSTQLQPGNYKVEWNGTGSAVQINFVKHDQTVATTSGKIVELKTPSPYDDVVLKPIENGRANTVVEIDFHNRREALRISPMEGKKSS